MFHGEQPEEIQESYYPKTKKDQNTSLQTISQYQPHSYKRSDFVAFPEVLEPNCPTI